MDYHNRMIEERDTKIKELEGEIERLEKSLLEKSKQIRSKKTPEKVPNLQFDPDGSTGRGCCS